MRVGLVIKRGIKRGFLVVSVWIAFGLVLELGYRGYLFLFRDFPDDPAAFDLYGVGESTVMGEPFQANFSLPSLVSSELDGHVTVNGANHPIRIRMLARQGESVYPQAIGFERSVAFRNPTAPGAVLIYAGHNERIPIGGQPIAPLSWIEKFERSFLVRHSWIAKDLLLYLHAKGTIRTQYSLDRYEYLFRRIIDDARSAGLEPILFAPASNLSGIEPNAPDDEHLNAVMASGTYLQRTNQLSVALTTYASEMPGVAAGGDALLSYEIGKCEFQQSRMVDARKDFHRAIDRDPRTNFGRSTSAQSETLHKLADDEHVKFIDAEAMFESNAPNRISGDDLFSDGQHPSLNGYALLANETARFLGPAYAFHDGNDLLLRMHLKPADLSRAHRNAGSWLITTAVHHPWPMDRMTLAQRYYRESAGGEDDFTSWAGVAIAEGAINGMLRDAASIDLLTRLHVWYSPTIAVPDSEWAAFMAALEKFKADPDTLKQLRLLHHSAP